MISTSRLVLFACALSVLSCRSPSEPTLPPPIVEGTPFNTLANVRQGLSNISYLAGFTESSGKTWFGGVAGAMLSRSGNGPWRVEVLPGSEIVTGIWGAGEELLVVAGFGMQSLVEGNWEAVPLPLNNSQLLELWGLDSDHVWAGGAGGRILFRDRGTWEVVDAPVPAEIWGIAAESPTDVVAVGQNGTILESSDGVEFVQVGSPTAETLFAVTSDGLGRFVAVGAGGAVLLRDGDTWEKVPVPFNTNYFDVKSTGPRSFLIVGDDGVILEGDGITWSLVDIGGGAENLRAITGAAGQRLVAGWLGTVLDESGGWSISESGTRIYAVHAAAAGNAMAVGRGGIVLERAGSSWGPINSPTGEVLLGVAGPNANDRLVVGDRGTVFHYDGLSWNRETVPTDESVRSIWYDGTRAMAVGEGGVAMVREGVAWRAVPTGTSRYLRHVWGVSFDRLWAVGDSGTMLRWNGVSFTPMPVPVTHNLRGGFSRSATDVWAVGDVGTLLHLEAGAWVKHFPPTLNDLRAIHAVDNVLYLAGELGRSFALKDEVWSPLQASQTGFWLGLGGVDELIAVGELGTIAEAVRD